MCINKKAAYFLVPLFSLMITGCDQLKDNSANNELKQQQEKLQQQIVQLEKQQAGLTRSTQALVSAVNTLDQRQQALNYTEFDPTKTRYFILNNGSVALAGEVLSIAPVNDGSVIHIALVNLLSTPISGVGFQMTWGKERPQDKKELTRWQQMLYSTPMKSNFELVPGQWKNIDLTLKGVSPNHLKYLKMSTIMDNVIFGSMPLEKTAVKSNKQSNSANLKK